jgi:hypothetical protein
MIVWRGWRQLSATNLRPPDFFDNPWRGESENPSEDVVGKSIVTTDLAGFLAPLDQALFGDFLKLASYLDAEGYSDAAAVICVNVLEGHLRKLSEKFQIAVTADNGLPKSADTLNRELAAQGAYSRLDQEHVSAWLDRWDHTGRGNECDAHDRAALLLEGVRSLLDRFPA